MPAKYAALPNPQTVPGDEDEMEAAFDGPDDDDDDDESRPLTWTDTPELSFHPPAPLPGSYDFENLDYDYPPPGSPPRRDRAIPDNDLGNTNGLIPSVPIASIPQPQFGWFARTASAILPNHYAQRIGLRQPRVNGVVGGGTNNDGVFANVSAKPTVLPQIVDEEGVYVMPEDAQKDTPPSYAAAQADAVPPYWETTVHAPSSPGTAGEIMIDGVQTGSLFSFLWNMLVSISFQFVGFLLTYLLHTTHAAKFGSRAGLGLTLIQYGFALRANKENAVDGEDTVRSSGWRTEDPMPTYSDAGLRYENQSNTTTSIELDGIFLGDLTSEWLSFLLMTIGWFVLLTSLLGFWRVKRWERSILSSNQAIEHHNTQAVPTLQRVFGVPFLVNTRVVRQGLGFSTSRQSDEELGVDDDFIVPISPTNPDRARLVAEAYANERRLQQDLRAAGLL